MSVFYVMAIFVLGLLPADAQPLDWETSYGKALEETRSDARPLLIVLDKPASADASLAPELLTPNEDAKQLELLQSYDRCHVDVTTEYGQKVADAFKAKTFPFVAVIDKTGSVIIYQKAGKTGSDEWNQMLAAHKAGERQSQTRVTYKMVNGTTVMFQQPGSYIMGSSYCPNCQRNAF